jgi:hypothetical protein
MNKKCINTQDGIRNQGLMAKTNHKFSSYPFSKTTSFDNGAFAKVTLKKESHNDYRVRFNFCPN